MKRFAPVIFLICFSVTSAGQKTENSDTEGGKLFFGLKTFNFIKNNEYFNPIIEGYTLIGSFIRPEIIYAPSPMFEIELGVHQQIYSGEPENIKPRLLLSARWKVAGNSILTLGSFDGGNKHRMYDPHFNAERIYTYYTENGASFVTKGENIFTDTWINWENFIFRGDTVREIFTAGESFNYSLPLIKDFIKINLPVQAKFKHYGGQISNYSEHVLTFLNLSGGAGIDFSFAHEKYGTPGIEFLHFIYRELTRKNDIGITEGDASWIRVHYRYRWLYIGSYFWFSHNFYAPDGNQIYGSVSDYQPGYIIPDRKIWTSSVYLTLKPYNLFEILLGFEGYYDFRLKRMDTAVSFHINFEKRLKLTSFKNN